MQCGNQGYLFFEMFIVKTHHLEKADHANRSSIKLVSVMKAAGSNLFLGVSLSACPVF